MKSSFKKITSIVLLLIICGVALYGFVVILKRPSYLNLRAIEIDAKAPVGIKIDDLRRIFGAPTSERIDDNGLLLLTYANSIKNKNGNYEYPISVTFFIEDGVVTARYFYVY